MIGIQKQTRFITSSITLDYTDLFKVIFCNSGNDITILLPEAAASFPNFNCDIYNNGSGDVICDGLVIVTHSHAHIVSNGVDWVVVIGGGVETDPVFSASEAYNITSTDTTQWDTAYSHSQSAHAPTNAQKNSDITKDEIEAKLTGEILTHTHIRYEPLVNGGTTTPEIMFDETGDIIMVEV